MVQAAEASTQKIRSWFDTDGWQLEPDQLRHELEQQGADEDLLIDLLDEGAERRRAQPAKPAEPRPEPQTAPAAANGADPQNLDAERSLLGAMLLSPAAIAAAQATGLTPDEFYRGQRHGLIYQAAIDLHDRQVQVESVTLADELEKRGQLDQIGGRVKVHELAALALVPGNAGHYAQIVREQARRRNLAQLGLRLTQAARDGTMTDALRAEAAIILDAPLEITVRERLIPGGQFILDQPDQVAAVWGEGDEIAWAAGEGLMLAGPQGVGKTTLAQQLALARCGLRDQVLGMPVQPTDRAVLYIAADRPKQAQRSLARMAGPLDRDTLNERLIVHRGPLEQLVDQDPLALARIAQRANAGTIVVDSLKDVALKLTDDETGAKVNLSYQHVVADGIELVVLHHQRKGTGENRKPNKLDDVYGSGRLTSGLGSVLLLWGEPGDVLVELVHLKPPAEEIGPWQLQHDHAKGATSRVLQPDLVELVYRASTDGITAAAAAQLALHKETPNRNEIEKTRRKLDRLADAGKLIKIAGTAGGADPGHYYHPLAAS